MKNRSLRRSLSPRKRHREEQFYANVRKTGPCSPTFYQKDREQQDHFSNAPDLGHVKVFGEFCQASSLLPLGERAEFSQKLFHTPGFFNDNPGGFPPRRSRFTMFSVCSHLQSFPFFDSKSVLSITLTNRSKYNHYSSTVKLEGGRGAPDTSVRLLSKTSSVVSHEAALWFPSRPGQ